MSDVVIVQPIADAGLTLLREGGLTVHVAPCPDLDALRGPLAAARAVITRNHGFSAEEIAAAPRLRVIGVHGTGMDAVDRAGAAARGIAVVNTPGTNARAVAELALTLMLACAKDLAVAERAAREGDTGFRDRGTTIELGGRCLGLVGYGRVARHVARGALGLGMEVCALSRHASAAALAVEGVRAVPNLDALCATADVISLHGLPGERTVFDAERFARLRPGAILINTARGALVDEAALAVALMSGRLGGAGIDVTRQEPLPPDSPLRGCPRLVLTPHIGGSAREALERTGVEVACRVLEALASAGVGP